MNALTTLIRGIAVEAEIGGKFAAKLSQSRKKFLGSGFLFHLENASRSDPHLDIIAILQFQRLDDGYG